MYKEYVNNLKGILNMKIKAESKNYRNKCI